MKSSSSDAGWGQPITFVPRATHETPTGSARKHLISIRPTRLLREHRAWIEACCQWTRPAPKLQLQLPCGCREPGNAGFC